MKCVYFGYDFMLPSIFRLLDLGHELHGIMSFECDNVFNFNQGCQNLCAELKIPFILSPVTASHIESFLEDGTELFISGGYPHKIPPINEEKARAINIHPTFLPYGRGIMPIPKIIKENIEKAAGFTAHKMTQKFDGGDILLQHKIGISKRESVESYLAKIAMRAPKMLEDLAANLDDYWENAPPQNESEASVFKLPSDQDRLLNWNKSVSDIDAVARAFGRFGSLAKLGDQILVVYAIDFWEEQHALAPGSIACQTNREITVAASNGFICIKDFTLAG